MWLVVFLQLADPADVIDPATAFARWQWLHDAPPIQDIGRLPPPAFARFALDFAHDHASYMETLANWQPEFRPWAIEAGKHREFYARCREAQSETLPLIYRRNALREMRNIIGITAYNMAEWPQAAPFWRFHEEHRILPVDRR